MSQIANNVRLSSIAYALSTMIKDPLAIPVFLGVTMITNKLITEFKSKDNTTRTIQTLALDFLNFKITKAFTPVARKVFNALHLSHLKIGGSTLQLDKLALPLILAVSTLYALKS